MLWLLLRCPGEQLLNTRCSDPNFYSVAAASDPIVKQIVENYTGAKLICDTTRLTSVPRNIFHVPSEKYVKQYFKRTYFFPNVLFISFFIFSIQ